MEDQSSLGVRFRNIVADPDRYLAYLHNPDNADPSLADFNANDHASAVLGCVHAGLLSRDLMAETLLGDKLTREINRLSDLKGLDMLTDY